MVELKCDLPSDLISWTIKEPKGEAWDLVILSEFQVGIGKLVHSHCGRRFPRIQMYIRPQLLWL